MTDKQREVVAAAEAAARAGGTSQDVLDAAYGAAARFPAAPAAAAAAAPEVAYRAGEGETLDEVAHLRYGTAAVVEQILAANPDLASARPRLPAGALVRLPPDAQAPAAPAVTLWS